MKYAIVTLIGFFLCGCKAQKLSFEQADLQKEVAGVQGGQTSYTFTLMTSAKEKFVGKFTKLWYNDICYEISKQNVSKNGTDTKVILYTQDPPRGFRSSQSPIPLTGDVTLVIEHSLKDKIEHLAVAKVIVKQTIAYPSAPPGE